MEEDDKPRLLERGPDGLEGVVVETLADTARAHDDALQVREGSDLVDRREQGLGRRSRNEREQAEAVEPLDAGAGLWEGGPGGAV